MKVENARTNSFSFFHPPSLSWTLLACEWRLRKICVHHVLTTSISPSWSLLLHQTRPCPPEKLGRPSLEGNTVTSRPFHLNACSV